MSAIRRRILWSIALCLASTLIHAAHAQGSESGMAPKFSDFPSLEGLSGPPVTIDLSSHHYARSYRTTLRKAAANGPDFAGHYVVAWWGCGNECVRSLIVDLNTGQVYGLLGKEEPLDSSRGVDIQLASRLLIADPPCAEDQSCLSEARADIPVRYYVMEDRGLRLIQEIPCRVANNGRECK